MSSQSMKYHSLPSLSDLKAYHQGKLSSDERSWIDSVINRNPMVAEVFKNAKTTNSAAVQRISSSTSDKIAQIYFPNRGFWSKYAGWIGLSSMAIILGSIYFFNLESISPKYVAEQSVFSIEQPQKAGEVILVSEENNQPNQDLNSETTSSDLVNEESLESRDQNQNSESNTVSGLSPKTKSDVTTPLTLEFEKNDKTDKLKGPDLKEPDNTRDFESNESVEKTGTVLLAVNSVNIVSKLNPDDFNTRNSGSSGNDPLGRGDTKRQNSASYSMDDLPSYPGGDQALINYFKGQLRPIEIPAKADQFDRSVMIELEVNSRGKLKDYKIFGDIHPTHHEQLEKAIKELPQFDKGKGEKVKYSLVISF